MYQYLRSECIIFRKTRDEYGEFSNMCGGFPLYIDGVEIKTSEALYQSMKFKDSFIQSLIVNESSPMTAKRRAYSYSHKVRSDWMNIRVDVMLWCLELKLAQNYHRFSSVLLGTGDKEIVEDSYRDNFWGAVGEETMVGHNYLGNLLMYLRERLRDGDKFREISPPDVEDFTFMDAPIGIIERW